MKHYRCMQTLDTFCLWKVRVYELFKSLRFLSSCTCIIHLLHTTRTHCIYKFYVSLSLLFMKILYFLAHYNPWDMDIIKSLFAHSSAYRKEQLKWIWFQHLRWLWTRLLSPNSSSKHLHTRPSSSSFNILFPQLWSWMGCEPHPLSRSCGIQWLCALPLQENHWRLW